MGRCFFKLILLFAVNMFWNIENLILISMSFFRFVWRRATTVLFRMLKTWTLVFYFYGYNLYFNICYEKPLLRVSWIRFLPVRRRTGEAWELSKTSSNVYFNSDEVSHVWSWLHALLDTKTCSRMNLQHFRICQEIVQSVDTFESRAFASHHFHTKSHIVTIFIHCIANAEMYL